MNAAIEKARTFAVKCHGDQMYGDKPYSVHLDEVADIAAEFGPDAAVISYLHDVVEDTDTSLNEIQSEFGDYIAECVAIVTDEPGQNRKERKAATYKKMAKVFGRHELALVVKAADRLANLRNCVSQKNTRLLAVYKDEHETFKSAAYRPMLCEVLWQELDNIINS